MDHEFPGGSPRCIYCGTLARETERKVCPGPQGTPGVKLLPPLPDKQRERAADEVDAIHARIVELETDRREALNRSAETE